MYRSVTRNIEVVVNPRFVADRSSPDNNYFFWAYTISITNRGAETVHSRLATGGSPTRMAGFRKSAAPAWFEEPVLKAGEAFEYTSGVPLQTASGFMVGTYGMVSAAGEHFDIDVPAFSLIPARPNVLSTNPAYKIRRFAKKLRGPASTGPRNSFEPWRMATERPMWMPTPGPGRGRVRARG